MLKIWERVRDGVASRWVEGAVLAAVAVQAFGTGPARQKPAHRAAPAAAGATHVVMASPDVHLLLPLGGALDPSPLESFDLRAEALRAQRRAAATRALHDAARAQRAAGEARRAIERQECERARRLAAPPAPAAPHAAPAAAPNLRPRTAV